jgi:hypothetical protein
MPCDKNIIPCGNAKTLRGLYWGGAVCIVLNGPGKFSLDYLVLNKILKLKTEG